MSAVEGQSSLVQRRRGRSFEAGREALGGARRPRAVQHRHRRWGGKGRRRRREGRGKEGVQGVEGSLWREEKAQGRRR